MKLYLSSDTPRAKRNHTYIIHIIATSYISYKHIHIMHTDHAYKFIYIYAHTWAHTRTQIRT